jgi:lysophospholipase L1-like esterase
LLVSESLDQIENRHFMKKLIVIIFILCILTTLSGLYYSKINTNSALNNFIKITHSHYVRKARGIDEHSIVFLGSSSIQALNVGQITDNGINLGIGGERLSGLINRLQDYPNIASARLLVFGAGFNDLCRSSSKDITSKYDNLLNHSREENLVISNMQPATSQRLCGDLYEKLTYFNNYLRTKCAALHKCYFVDLHNLLSEKQSLVFEPDGIHLNKLGYDLWQAELEKVITQIKNEGK